MSSSRGASYELFIRPLPSNLSDRALHASLNDIFGRFGEINHAKIRCDPIHTFAFVQFRSEFAALQAIYEVHGSLFSGKKLSVSWSGDSLKSFRTSEELIVRFLPFDVSILTVRSLFGQHGSLTNVHIPYDRQSGHKVGDAFVRFLHESDAERAMDALDGHAMTRGTIRVAWTTASKPSGHVSRVLDLPAAADRKMLRKIFNRYAGLRRIKVDYDRSGRSYQMGFMTFANREQALEVVREFDGRFFRDGEGTIRLQADRLNRELERAAAAEAASCPAASSASPRTAIPDLLTGSVIHVTANANHIGASTDLIDLSDPAPTALPSVAISPVEVGYIYAEKRQYEIPIHFYAVPETEKLETATQILLDGFCVEQDLNNNISDQRNTKVTLVVRGMPELVAAMGRINVAGMDCFTCDDHSIRGGHSIHPSEWMTVNVTMAPICNKIKYSQHVVFLSPIDDPEDMGAAMDVMMLERTHVNVMSVLFDESDGDQRSQVSQMMNLLR